MFKFAIVFVVLGVISLGALIYPNFSHKMPYKQPTKELNVEYCKVDYKMSNGAIRQRIKELVGVNFYCYKEKSSNGKVGNSNLFLRQVVINSEAGENEYIENFCHELLHIKYYTTNERFVTFKTFVTLYESEFRQVAINMAWEMQQGYVDREYDCLGQICDYLAQ